MGAFTFSTSAFCMLVFHLHQVLFIIGCQYKLGVALVGFFGICEQQWLSFGHPVRNAIHGMCTASTLVP